MNDWMSSVRSDPLVFGAVVFAVVATGASWFVWPDSDAVEAVQAVALAVALVVLLVRGLLGPRDPFLTAGVAVAVVGLLIEVAYAAAGDDPPLAVMLIFPAGLVLIVVSGLRQSRATAR